jgi:hypothetical protein
MGLNQQDSMAVVNIVVTGLAMLGYLLMSNSRGATSTTASHKKTTSHRASSVGGKTRRRR